MRERGRRRERGEGGGEGERENSDPITQISYIKKFMGECNSCVFVQGVVTHIFAVTLCTTTQHCKLKHVTSSKNHVKPHNFNAA